MRRGRPRCGFTLVELAACVAAAGVVVAAAALGTGQPEGASKKAAGLTARLLKDQTQIRGIVQSCIVWAQNNKDAYPLPSVIDAADATVPEKGAAKDTSANIMSLLVYNGFVPVELLVSPVESNPSIKAHAGYEFDKPKGAVDSSKALWDPGFSAEFTGGKTEGLSYAHLQPSGGRKARWSNTFVSNEAVISMRGPEVRGVTKNDDGSVTPTFADENTRTTTFYGEGKAWSWNMGFNDCHVEFVKEPFKAGRAVKLTKDSRRYTGAASAVLPDLWCFDEPDDGEIANDYLGVFVKAGEHPKEFTAIWD
jgi:prepilin-type N-terminal cleavage/methylation domain-containing protein